MGVTPRLIADRLPQSRSDTSEETTEMHFKLIVALVDDTHTEPILDAARDKGAMGATVVSRVRGEGVDVKKTFLGLSLETSRDMLLFLVEEHLSREILETIERVGDFDRSGAGIAFQIDVEDAVGVGHQMELLQSVVDEKL